MVIIRNAALPAVSILFFLTACGGTKTEPAVSPPPQTTFSADMPAPQHLESTGLADGAVVKIQLLETLDSDARDTAPFITAKVAEDVAGSDGKLALPAGSRALLVVRQGGRVKDLSTLAVTLHSVFAGGSQVHFVDGLKDLATATFTEDAAQGPSHRTVHLGEDTVIPFKLTSAISLK